MKRTIDPNTSLMKNGFTSIPSIFNPIVPYPSEKLTQQMNEVFAAREAREKERDENQREMVRYARSAYYIAIAAVVISVAIAIRSHML